MTLRKPLFASLAILALAVPVTGGAIVPFIASPAMAKGGNGKGGSERSSGSDRSRADRDKGSRSSSSRGRSGNGGFGTSNGNGRGNGGGGFGQSGKVTPAKAAPTAEPMPEEGTDEMHPSQLGSMNGAMNANINAVLAHIRNGNTNGPVGALAGLAVADHDAAEAQEVIDTAEDFAALDRALEDAGYETVDDYLESGETDTAIEEAIAALGDRTDEDRPSEDEITDAQTAIDALPEAEAAIFEAWNKSGSATEEEKAALLEALRDRLEGDSALIEETIAGTNGETDEGGDDDTGDDDSDDSDEDTAALDAETKAIIDGLKY